METDRPDGIQTATREDEERDLIRSLNVAIKFNNLTLAEAEACLEAYHEHRDGDFTTNQD